MGEFPIAYLSPYVNDSCPQRSRYPKRKLLSSPFRTRHWLCLPRTAKDPHPTAEEMPHSITNHGYTRKDQHSLTAGQSRTKRKRTDTNACRETSFVCVSSPSACVSLYAQVHISVPQGVLNKQRFPRTNKTELLITAHGACQKSWSFLLSADFGFQQNSMFLVFLVRLVFSFSFWFSFSFQCFFFYLFLVGSNVWGGGKPTGAIQCLFASAR